MGAVVAYLRRVEGAKVSSSGATCARVYYPSQAINPSLGKPAKSAIVEPLQACEAEWDATEEQCRKATWKR